VRDKQEKETARVSPRSSKRLPALLPIDQAIIDNYMKRVEKDMDSFFKADAMPALI
jgi:hypothetical protein